MKWTPYQFQVDAVRFLLERGGAGLWLDPGLGKTSIVLAALSILKQEKGLDRALVIAPLTVAHHTWPNERKKWHEDFGNLRMNILHGPEKLARLKNKNIDIDLINPEGLQWLFNTPNLPKWRVLVIDESTKFKSWGSVRTKILRNNLFRFQRRWTLTGTPAPNGLEDVFSQVFLMDGGAALGRFITHFRNTYMVSGGYMGYQWFPRPGAWDEVAERLAPLVMRLRAEDWIKLPPLIYNTIEVTLPPEVRVQYDQLEENFLLELGDRNVLAGTAAALQMKLRQATNGVLYADGGSVVLHTEKLEALVNLKEELGASPLLVAVSFLTEVDMIRAHFDTKNGTIPYLGGGVSMKDRANIIDRWNKGQIPLLLCHPAAVSHGLNMQEHANHICWFGLTWNLEEYEQMIRRIWRQGQTERVICHHIVAEDTMDQPVLRSLSSKDKNQKALLERVRHFRDLRPQ
jgi:SNF2 family DNA or RNA helicase